MTMTPTQNDAARDAGQISTGLYLIEFYTTNPQTGEGGWDINFAWVFAPSKAEAKTKLVANQGRRFDCVITNEEQGSIFPLVGNFRVNTPDANLFIIR